MAAILVVGDERMMCDLLRAVLARRGYEIILASNGRDGIALFNYTVYPRMAASSRSSRSSKR